MLNYTLSIVERRTRKILKNYLSVLKEHKSEKQLFNSLVEVLDFLFFIYSAHPKVNITVKLCRILGVIVKFSSKQSSNSDYKHLIYKLIYDNICFILKSNKTNPHTQVEALYLLKTLGELGKDYWLEEASLANYIGVSLNDVPSTDLNYFTLTVLFSYMKNKKRYSNLRHALEKVVVNKICNSIPSNRKSAEHIFLTFDMLVCPYIDETTRSTILDHYNIPDSLQQDVVKKQKHWFTKWEGFNFEKELDSKHSQEVY